MNRVRCVLALVAIGLVMCGCVEKRKPAAAGAARGGSDRSAAPASPAAPQKPRDGQSDMARPAVSPADYLRNVVRAEETAVKTIDLATVNEAIRQFQAMEGRSPRSLDELVSEKYLPAIPPTPPGLRIAYDPATGEVSIQPVPN